MAGRSPHPPAAPPSPSDVPPATIDLAPGGHTAQTLCALLEQALQSPAAVVALRSYLEGRGVASGAWRIDLVHPPTFRLVRQEE